VRFLFIRAEKACYPLTVLCRVLEVSRSGYYAFEKRSPSMRENADRELTEQIREIHRKSRRTYGSPRVHREFRDGRRQRVGCKRVARLMRMAGIVGRRRRKFCRTTDSSHGLPVAENLLNRRFEMTQPNQGWVGDVTYIRTVAGWLYLAVILDLFSRRVVGYALSRHNDTRLALAALEAALRCRTVLSGLLHHTDQGSPYASDDYQAALKTHGIVCSMSRRGNCWDNAVSESFFSTLKSDLDLDDPESTPELAAAQVVDYIDNFYNPERRHSSLDYLSPIEYELRYHRLQQTT
jgi:transposase InsO family protein